MKTKVTWELTHEDAPDDDNIWIKFHDTEEEHLCHPPKPDNIEDFIKQITSAYLAGREDGIYNTCKSYKAGMDKYTDNIMQDLMQDGDVYLSFDLKEQP